MQYGNYFTVFFIFPPCLFKSYYVVWKPLVAHRKRRNRSRFKSYYVVWKQVEAEIGAQKNMVFKSYYVVWKRSKILWTICRNNSLNRTMQYGNRFPLPCMLSLVLCLNRTMQYGNTDARTRKKEDDIGFKSYYVVWKLQGDFAKNK